MLPAEVAEAPARPREEPSDAVWQTMDPGGDENPSSSEELGGSGSGRASLGMGTRAGAAAAARGSGSGNGSSGNGSAWDAGTLNAILSRHAWAG